LTLYIRLRSREVGGSVVDPRVLEGDDPQSLRERSMLDIRHRVAGRSVVFGVHGFNVNQREGVWALGRLEPLLGLGESDVFFGVLWPGDFWVPVINYPFEGSDARDSGRRLAALCRAELTEAASFSFISHSLGARVVLEAVRRLDRKARAVCLTAGAIDRDCLTKEYKDAFENAELVTVLASRSDRVVQLAFPLGDFFSDLFRRSQDVRGGLGYNGPPRPVGATVPPWQIPDAADYGHGDYLPPSTPAIDPERQQKAKWMQPAGFMRRTLRGERQTWP
jgi:pimeloyl-ACP methyl ester carboxylesterase